MDKQELNTSELRMIVQVLESDIQVTEEISHEIDFSEVDVLEYYLGRAKVLRRVKEVLAS
jgi:hypothetical protein